MPTVFLYADQLTRPPLAAWLEGDPGRPAWTRGSLWRGARPQRVLVADTGAERVVGVLLELDVDRTRVLDLLLGGPGVRRLPVPSAIGLRPVRAEAWALPDARTARNEGYRPVRSPS